MPLKYHGIQLSYKTERNDAICSNLDRPRDHHTKWSKSERESQIPYDITYMWKLKYNRNELIYKTETDSLTDTENRLLVAKRDRRREWIGSLGLADANYYIYTA